MSSISRIFHSPQRVLKQNLPQKATVITQNFVGFLDDEESRRVREEELESECSELQLKYEDLRMKYVASRKDMKTIKLQLAALKEQNDHLVWTNKQQAKRMKQIQKESDRIMRKHNVVKAASFAKNVFIAGCVVAAIPQIIRVGKQVHGKLTESE